MGKRVQFIRHTTGGAAAFVGLEGEITVDTTAKEARIHDGITAGGTPVARKDLANVSNATSGTAGKMSAAHVGELSNATDGIVAEEAARILDVGAEASARAAADLLLIPLTQRGAVNGVATLNGSAKVEQVALAADALTGLTTSISDLNDVLTSDNVKTVSNKTMAGTGGGTCMTFVDDETGPANWIRVRNAASADDPSLEASGGATNINLNLVSKGTGEVQANGLTVFAKQLLVLQNTTTQGWNSGTTYYPAWNASTIDEWYGSGFPTIPTNSMAISGLGFKRIKLRAHMVINIQSSTSGYIRAMFTNSTAEILSTYRTWQTHQCHGRFLFIDIESEWFVPGGTETFRVAMYNSAGVVAYVNTGSWFELIGTKQG